MGAEISILLDVRRIKKEDVYPLKLRVYCSGKTELYPTIYGLSQEHFKKLGAKRLSDAMSTQRDKINEMVTQAQMTANNIYPFNFKQFYRQFIYGHPLFKEKKNKAKDFVSEDLPQKYPEAWTKKFPILTEVHPGPDYISLVYSSVVKSLLFQGRIGSASAYQSSYASLKAFRGNVRFSQVTATFLKEYEAWMTTVQGNSKTTVGIYTRALRAVFNEAIGPLRLISKEHYPFSKRKYAVPTGRNIKKALDPQSIAKLYRATTGKAHEQKAKDYWFFSFYGNGMNVKDIIGLKYGNVQGEFLVFERAKTLLTTRGKDPIVISTYITEDMWRIIGKWGNRDNDPDNYIFPVLKRGLTPLEEFRIKQNFTRFINKNMAKLGIRAELSKKPRTMEARHSSSTMMKNAGISPHFIKEALGHSSLKTTENYLGGFENQQKKEFSKVLESIKQITSS